jgi:oligopeptide/dipeptide ABC transporter ATP-binding protein
MSAPRPLLELRNLEKHFPIRGGVFFRQVGSVQAVQGVSLSIREGETLGLVGESGCGKSTLGKTLLQLEPATGGQILFNGEDIAHFDKAKKQQFRRDVQIIFQDPYESLNARHTIADILKEPFVIHGIGNKQEREGWVDELLEKVGLPASARNRFPHEFSGGQRQRIGIARAIALKPKLIICDEPVSALDVSIQSQIINLLLEIQQEMNLAMLFIAHDLAVVKHISDRVAVMYLGELVETATAEHIYSAPRHPYTQALISAVPVADPRRRTRRLVLQGDVPSPVNPPSGCNFHPRCPYARENCRVDSPRLEAVIDNHGHAVACYHWDNLAD